MKKKFKNIKGQTMMEYIIIVALLAVASIPVAKILGDVFRDRVALAAREISGESGYSSQSKGMIQDINSKIKRSMRDFYQ